MDVKSYIVASSKVWHKAEYDNLCNSHEGIWYWVTTPEELIDCLNRKTDIRYIFFLHWNWLVPEHIWSNQECVCFHMTDVPYGRGGSPLQNLIKAGHQTTQLTALRMVEAMDAGPVYAKRSLSLDGRAEEIYIRAGKLSMAIIRCMTATEPVPESQVGEVTLFKRRRPDQSALPQEGSMESLYDHIRMLDAPSYPLAFIKHGNFRIEFSHAELAGDGVTAKVIISRRPETTKD